MGPREAGPRDEVVADLRDYFDAKLPVELWWPDEQEPDPGYIGGVEDNYVVLARLRQQAWLNGYLAARFTAIKEVLPLVTPVWFGSNYERVLERIGSLLDRPRKEPLS